MCSLFVGTCDFSALGHFDEGVIQMAGIDIITENLSTEETNENFQFPHIPVISNSSENLYFAYHFVQCKELPHD